MNSIVTFLPGWSSKTRTCTRSSEPRAGTGTSSTRRSRISAPGAPPDPLALTWPRGIGSEGKSSDSRRLSERTRLPLDPSVAHPTPCDSVGQRSDLQGDLPAQRDERTGHGRDDRLVALALGGIDHRGPPEHLLLAVGVENPPARVERDVAA